MKNFWNVVGRRFHASRIYMIILSAILLGAISTSGIASAHSVSQKDKPLVQSVHSIKSSHTVHPHGTNGQQLALWIGSSLRYESVLMVGINQSGQPTAVCNVGPNGTPIPADQWRYLNNYWWVNSVSLFYYTSTGCSGTKAYTATANVPGYQAFSDYWCFSLRTSQDPDPGSC